MRGDPTCADIRMGSINTPLDFSLTSFVRFQSGTFGIFAVLDRSFHIVGRMNPWKMILSRLFPVDGHGCAKLR